MARKPPKYALHKPSGQARVRINGKDIYLGEFNSPSSREQYERLLAKYFLGSLDVHRDCLQIARLGIMYVEHARGYYVKDGIQKASRKTSMTPSQAERSRQKNPKRQLGKYYQRTSYTRAIARACRRAKVSEWSPNQMRHNAATNLPKIHGLEGTRTVLGHSTTDKHPRTNNGA